MTGRPSSRARPVVALIALAAALAFLHVIGSGPLAAPPLTSIGGFRSWLDGREPVGATFALLRLAGLASGWYVAGATVLQVAARVSRLGGLHAVADAVSAPLVRHLASGLVGVTITVLGTGDERAATPRVAAMRHLDPPDGIAVLTRVPDDVEVMTPLRPIAPSDELPADDRATLERLDAADGERWVVERGDHLWSIAEQRLAEAWSRPVSDCEVDPYWQVVVEANRASLVDPTNPDLLLAGQSIELPPPPSAPSG